MTRRIILTFDREAHGGWPYVASTEVADAPQGKLSAAGPTEEHAIANLRRVVEEWEASRAEQGYSKVVEVDW